MRFPPTGSSPAKCSESRLSLIHIFHRTGQNLLGLELLELRHHIGVHAARNLGFLDQLVGLSLIHI